MQPIDKLLHEFNLMAVLYSAVRVVAILVVAWIIAKVISYSRNRFRNFYMHRLEAQGDSAAEAKKRADTLIQVTYRMIFVVFWIVISMMILMQVGIHIAPLLASVGIVGVALGFGAQALVRDVISGFFIILENQIRVGDVASLNGTGGVIEAINFRTTLLRDINGALHVFRNGEITAICNMTRDWGGYSFDIGVSYNEDMDKVIRIIERVGLEMRKDDILGRAMISDLEVFGVNQLADSAVIVKGRIKTRPGEQWTVGRSFLNRIKKAFDSEGINFPYPHRTLEFSNSQLPIVLREQGASTDVAKD